MGLTELRRHEAGDGSFILVFLGNNTNTHQLELTWPRDWERPYELVDIEIHLGFVVDDFEKAYEHHTQMRCICYENKSMGIYFSEDPNGYWMENMPKKR